MRPGPDLESSSRSPDFSPEDQPLREDVSRAGSILGTVLKHQGGDALFDLVERARLQAMQRRAAVPGAEEHLAATLSGLETTLAREVVRAFSVYFSLVNIAEQVHRVRRSRRIKNDPDSILPGGLTDVISRLERAGVTPDQIRQIATRLHVVPVLTAHPTRATRRTILAKEQRIAEALISRMSLADNQTEAKRTIDDQLHNEIGLIWQTEEQPALRPTVADEVEFVLFYLKEFLYAVVPELERSLSAALTMDLAAVTRQPPVTFGTWVGGDMDGNPNVGAATISDTLARQHELIIGAYRGEVRHLFDHLSQSYSRVEVDPMLIDRVSQYQALIPELTIPDRYLDMPYRVLLWLIWERLGARLDATDAGYGSSREFLADLELIAGSLRDNRGSDAGLALVEDLIIRVECFGFHLATLDIRQDAEVHRRVVGRLLGRPDFPDRSPAERIRVLNEAAVAGTEPDDPELRDTLKALQAIAEARRRYGERAIGPYIISMARGADDVLVLLKLARHAGLVDQAGRVPLDVAPLLETVDDLEQAGTIIDSLLANPDYRDHLDGRGGEQLIMLGYSDSSKISGITASRWSLFRAQEELVEKAHAAGIKLTLFHGRGGTVGRGGSKPRDGILASPCGAVRGHLRVTEQGEIIHAKFGLAETAERTLELMAGAVLESTALCDTGRQPKPSWVSAMNTMAAAARASYDDLVHHHPDFITYFRAATPIDVIEGLEIGSRPSKRKPDGGIDSLRAIPWVFAWTQSRHLLPGWYGLGAGLEQAIATHGEDLFHEMAVEFPFFSVLLADVEMVLAKSDMDIAARYAELAGEVGENVFATIRRQHDSTCHQILELRGCSAILDREPVLKQNIALRNPYVDPISLLQVDLLKRWRAGGRQDRDLELALFDTVRGIARGLQNTG